MARGQCEIMPRAQLYHSFPNQVSKSETIPVSLINDIPIQPDMSF